MLVLIAAAGSGRRMGTDRNKLLLPLMGKPILRWTLDAILACKDVSWIGLVGQRIDQVAIETIIAMAKPDRPVAFIEGGETRQNSISRGLALVPNKSRTILIHDGARCLIEPDLVSYCVQAVQEDRSVIAAMPVVDTIKLATSEGLIVSTPNRSELWAAQTPQGFSVNQLRKAHIKAIEKKWAVTDDASIYEHLGWPVSIVHGVPTNIKITTQFDLAIAETVLKKRTESKQ
uniref:2-C-methyl-D-erythritol 4-phosphate cytidylyltransferase, chloroplastic n=1 Tax=Paulinella chromatophora TaxID=39717 RepID=B1X5E8_PAUCH|nr:2-C-methyl-D-erythritol 4-phosphate cytidylyltransferase [Paulinella chromatophora]ACB43167.1 2-C-methyl-D-erythritol 4-phosphate cytidylyltransferase [Paulinella chromatophora]